MPDGPEPYSSMRIFILLFCLILSALFTAAEFALTTLSKIQLKNMVENGEKNASLVEALLAKTNKFNISLKLGSFFSIFLSIILTTLIAHAFIKNNDITVAVVTFVFSIIAIIFCEIIPKSIASQNSAKLSLKLARFVQLTMFVFTPLTAFINFVSGGFVSLFGFDKNKSTPMVTEAEILTMVNIGQQEGVVESDEQVIINNLFAFGDFKARDIMIPRMDIIAIDVETPYDEIIKVYKEEGYSRLPVYAETSDTIIGILYIKDFAFVDKENFDIRALVREPFYTYEGKASLQLFKEMKEQRISLAMVLDEYGGTAGLITINDFVEGIIGEISDEYDDDAEAEIELVKEDEYIVEGSTRLEVVNEMLGLRLESEDFDSIGGYVIGIFGYIPENGEEIEDENVKFKVEAIDKNRVEKVRVFV